MVGDDIIKCPSCGDETYRGDPFYHALASMAEYDECKMCGWGRNE